MWTLEHCEVVDHWSIDLEPAVAVRNERGRIVVVLMDDFSIARAPGNYAYCTAQNPPTLWARISSWMKKKLS